MQPICRQLGQQLSRKRALLEQPLQELGFKVLPGEGAYFLIADARWVALCVRRNGKPTALRNKKERMDMDAILWMCYVLLEFVVYRAYARHLELQLLLVCFVSSIRAAANS